LLEPYSALAGSTSEGCASRTTRELLYAQTPCVCIARAGCLGVGDAAASLGVKEEVVYQLVSRGLLAATGSVRFGGSRVAVDELERFRETYISLAALAKQRKTSSQALLCKLCVGPVTGPTVDGGRQYFLRRSEVAPRSALERDEVADPSAPFER
jgi:hypothetical protein